MSEHDLDAIVVGAGPNGLAAAIDLARAGRSVRVYEAADTIGGGTRSAEVTLPGYVHDICASVHPLSLASPFLRSLDLGRHGLEWVQPEAPVAHALAPGRSVVLERDLAAVDDALGRDADAWRRLFGPYVREWERLVPAILAPVIRPPRHPVLLARFGLPALLPATSLARLAFREPAARALFAGMAAHSMLRLGSADERLVRPRAGAARACRGLARRARRQRGDRRGARGGGALAGRGVRDRPPRGRDRRPAARPGVPAGRHAPPGAGDGRRPPAGRLPAPARGVPLRTGRVQDRLGARRPDPVEGPRDGARRDGPHRGHATARSPRPRTPSGEAGTPTSRTSFSSSRRSPIPPVPRRASTSPGPTATSRTAPPRT